MEYTKQLKLTEFDFWSGAKQHSFTYNELNTIEDFMSDIFTGKTPSETDINDLFWFEEEFLCNTIGLDINEYENR